VQAGCPALQSRGFSHGVGGASHAGTSNGIAHAQSLHGAQPRFAW